MPVEIPKIITNEKLFKPVSSDKESNASRTDRNARSIQQIETDARIEKTIRLRNARMAQEQTIILPITNRKKKSKSSKKVEK